MLANSGLSLPWRSICQPYGALKVLDVDGLSRRPDPECNLANQLLIQTGHNTQGNSYSRINAD
jgi:hypothetical protein